MHITRHRPADHPGLTRLLRAAVAELDARYPEEPTDPRLAAGAEFLLAEVDGAAAGCVALVPLPGGRGEVKRMFVDPAHRGRGIARSLLAALEGRCRELGLGRVVLETGVRQPESVALYEGSGYAPAPPYGPHVAGPLSLCYAKDL